MLIKLAMLTKSKLIPYPQNLPNGTKPMSTNKLKLPKNMLPFLSIPKNLAAASLGKPWPTPPQKGIKTNGRLDQFLPIPGPTIPT